jgi:alkylation response protein AidB-like acyl-CoA dehydrogenase
MDFEYSDEQRQLADSVRKFLAQSYGFEQRKSIVDAPRGDSEAVWSTFAEMGLAAIALPEAHGGFGGGAVDLLPVMEACGEALVVEPLLDHVVSARLLAKAGHTALLPGAADGSTRLAFAYLEPGRRYELAPSKVKATKAGDGWVLNGEKCVVVGAAAAHKLVVSADAGGASLFVVDAKAQGVSLNRCRTVDGQRAADVRFENVRLGADALAGQAGAAQPLIDEAVDFAIALQCADAVGAMTFANDTTLDYLKTRKQFGVPIGSFQALQHRVVEMFIHTEQARSMAILAAAKVDSAAGADERRRAVSGAKVKIADAARIVAQEAVQLHGGMGMTEELKISHTFRRLTTIGQRFGDADHHLERYARIG